MIGSALVINGGGNVAAHTHRIPNHNQCHHNAATHNQKPDGTPLRNQRAVQAAHLIRRKICEATEDHELSHAEARKFDGVGDAEHREPALKLSD